MLYPAELQALGREKLTDTPRGSPLLELRHVTAQRSVTFPSNDLGRLVLGPSPPKGRSELDQHASHKLLDLAPSVRGDHSKIIAQGNEP